MEYTYPEYYKKFQCIAEKCENTCCAGWGIAIDDKTLEKYRNCKGSFGNRLHNSINWKEQSFEQTDKCCAFLNEQNLCDIYSEVGKDMLCKTCKRYPRHIEEFENLREVSLSLSCPEVARIILGRKKKTKFLTSFQETKEEEYEEFNFFLFTKLQEIRDFLMEVVQNAQMSLEYRMSFLVAVSHDIQTRISKGKLYEIDDLLERYRQENFQRQAEKKFAEYSGCPVESYEAKKQIYKNLYELEVLDENWTKRLKAYEELLYKEGEEAYQKSRQEFRNYYKAQEYQYTQILVYFLFGYFGGAVYDENAYDKVRFAVVNTLLIQEMDIALWISNGKKMDFGGQVDLVHRFAREMEHSDPNLEEMEVMIGYQEEYSLENLLYCIWN
ncbi:MAG: flagellin lysine-N-methylase [Lachnospiraceae bacterium]|nr:flagellin lysine-N-methylase [Lachnospiraceae bacterium]